MEFSMSQISPASQSLYSGGMPSGTASYASPAVPSLSTPHEGMSTLDKAVIGTASGVAAVAVGAGIYYLATKDKSSSKKTSDTFPPLSEIEVIDKLDHLTLAEKEQAIKVALELVKTPDELRSVHTRLLISMNGKLSPEMKRNFERKAREEFAMELSPIGLDLINSEQFKNSTELQQIQAIKDYFEKNEEIKTRIAFFKNDPKRSENTQLLRMYYKRCISPNVSHAAKSAIIDGFKEFNIHL
jgi:hypothetical protein